MYLFQSTEHEECGGGGGGGGRTWIVWRRQKIGVKDLLEEEKQRPANMVRFGNVRPPLSC